MILCSSPIVLGRKVAMFSRNEEANSDLPVKKISVSAGVLEA